MKNGFRKTALLVLSCAGLIGTIGYSSWVAESSKSYSINNRDTISKPVAYIVGKEKVKYTTIEKALSMAVSGDIVCVIPPEKDNYHPSTNVITPDKVTYDITRDCEIKEGVTLVLPTDKATFSSVTNASTLSTYITSMREDDRSHGETTAQVSGTKASYGRHASAYEKNYLRVTVNVKENVTVTNKGTIVVSGYLSGGANAGAGMRGQTSHSYAQIVLGSNASIVQSGSNATFHCYGYVKEEAKGNGSTVVFQGGTIYMPLIVNDYKGFVFLSGIQEAVQGQGCSPFNRLEMRNFGCSTQFRYGSSLYGVTNIFYYQDAGSLGTYTDTLHNQFKIIGNGTDALINLTDSTYSCLEAYFDSSSSKMKLNFIGGAKIGNLAFKISASGKTIDLNTKYGYFPISYGMELEFSKASGQSAASFDSTSQKIKLLTGSSMTIHTGCAFTGSELISLSAFIDGSQGQRDDVKWSAGTSYPLKEGATFVMEDGASLTMSKFGGIVYSDSASGISYTTNTVSVKEGWNQKQSGIQYVTKDYLEMTETARVVPISSLSKKKVFLGLNRFVDPSSSATSYVPAVTATSGETEQAFNGSQGILFLDAIENVKINLVSNVAKIRKTIQATNGTYPALSDYALDELTGSGNLIACAINSSVSISSNNGGINEFEVQNISIKSLTAKVDGKDPLFIGGDIYLAAEISNAEQAYDKTVVWASLDESIATVDQTGKVTGVALGSVTITATCGGKTAYYNTEVIEDSTKIGIADAWIQDASGKSSKTKTAHSGEVDRPAGYGTTVYPTWEYSAKYTANSGTTKFYLKYSPDNAVISKVTWSYVTPGGKSYLLDYSGAKDDDNNLVDDGSLSATVQWNGYTNTTPDGAVLKCVIEDITGQTTTVEFFILHDSGVNVCIVEGTRILLANGREKAVEEVDEGDVLLAFDHERGRIVPANLFFNYHKGENNVVTAPILKLVFSNGTEIETHVDHGFFDYSRGEYVYINTRNYQDFIGDEFLFLAKGRQMKRTRLLSGTVQTKTVRVYSPVSEYHLNVFTNGLLSITGEIEGWFNYFDYDQNLKYVDEKMKADIEEYGLYCHKDFEGFIRKEIFDLLPIPYLKVSVGKGLTTKEKIIEVMKRYLSFM